jgi:hypothetical protein
MKNNSSGFTVLELVITILIAAIAAEVIFSGSLLVIKLWKNYRQNVEASGGAWTVYRSIEQSMMKSCSVKRKSPDQWVFLNGPDDSFELAFTDKFLRFRDSSERIVARLDSFYLEMDDTSGLYPIWMCRFALSREGGKSAMAWRTLCRGSSCGFTIPLPCRSLKVPSFLYWENITN